MKTIARWTTLVALFTIPFLPLYVANDLFFPFITGKNFAFRILVEIALVAYLLLAAMDRQYRPKFSWLLVFFGGLVAWMAVANTLGVLPGKAFWSNFERMDGWVTLVHLFAFFVVASGVLGAERLWRRWWLFFISVAGLVCAYGLIQLTGGAEIHQGGIRLTASFGNAIYLAVYLMFSFFVAGWLAVKASSGTRYALFVFMALAALVLFFTGSRGPLVGLGAGTVFATMLWLVLAWRDRKSAAVSQGLKIAAGGLAVLVLLAGALFVARDEAFVTGNPFLSRAASLYSLGHELSVRSTIWGMALKGVAEDPITGWGQEGFNQVFNKYYEPSLYNQESWFDRAHNLYIDWLVAGGIPALFLFIGMLALCFLGLLRAGDLSRAERVFLLAALVAYAVQAIVVFDNLFSYVPFVMLLAIAHAAHARPVPQVANAPELSGEAAQGAALAVGGAAAIFLAWSVNAPGIRAAHHTVYALSPAQNAATNLAYFEEALNDGSFASQEIREQMVMFAARTARNEQVPQDIRVALVNRALEEIGKEIEHSPNDARLRIQYASAFEAAGNDDAALAQIDAAIALSPRKQALHISRGFKLYELGRTEEAKASFLQAYELDTAVHDVAVSAATGFIALGSVAEGKALLMDVIGTTTPDNEQLFFAYYQAKQWNELIGVAQARVTNQNGAPEARYRLAQAYAAAGRFTEARKEITETMAAFPETRATGEALIAQIFVPAR